MRESKPIFYDERQRRWRRTRRALEISGSIFTLLLITFFITVLRSPDLPELLRPQPRPVKRALKDRRPPKAPVVGADRHQRVAALGKVPENYDPLRAAFYVNWDPGSLAALQKHHRDLDLLIPEMLHAVFPDGRMKFDLDHKLSAWMESAGVELPIMALVNNYDGKVWRIQEMARMLANAEARKRLTRDLTAYALNARLAGIVVDFEEVPDASQGHFRQFGKELAESLHQVDLKLMVALPAADQSYDYAYFASQADAIILMNYDQHWPTSAPGPIAAQDWFVHNVSETVRQLPPQKVIVAIANYAYDWVEPARGVGRAQAQSTSFQQAIITAQESEGTVEFDSESLNPHYSYVDEQGRVHQVWMLDGVTAYNQLRAAERAAVRGTVLWRLGSEDPSLWSIWDETRADDAARARLGEVPPGYDLILEGAGDIWRITAKPQKGQRTFRYDAVSETIVQENYSVYPLSYRIDQVGAAPRKIALTFDDGPDPRFTGRILDILKEKKVPAAFFVIGKNASGETALLRRIYAEGHEIGNHTYFHPHFDEISRTQLKFELNVTQWLLESRLKAKTILFRPPFGVDHQPESADEVEMLPIAQEAGYAIIGSKIDPHDWGAPGGGPPPPATEIAKEVLKQARDGQGNIVLLHDGGGDRKNTVDALPQIIDGLRAEGFELVSVSALLGQARAQTMPPLAPGEVWPARADAFVFDLYGWLRMLIAGVFVAGIALVSGRALIIGLLALVEKLRTPPAADPAFHPPVSVLIPAFNEEEVIVETVQSVLASDYPDFEVIVLDDGSTDRTYQRLEENFGNDPRVRLFRLANRGKASALNFGLARATGGIIVTIDADTTIVPATISMLVRDFTDPRVGAVAGNAKVSNRNLWLTRWQALEYITSQNLEKRAFDLLNCITVVPGAVGAWRIEAIRACGGFSRDTVAEDTDLTLAIRRRGWRINYEERAVGFTHAPETAQQLVRQRFRWTFGTLQAFWKHRDTLGRPRYGTLGLIGLPNIFLFQIFLPLVSPAIDLLFAGSLLLWGLGHIPGARLPQLWTGQDVIRALLFFMAFMLIDLLACVIAFALEKDEDWSLLMPLLWQRFYYRQVMYFVLFSALMRAVQGRAVGWEGIEPAAPKAKAAHHA